jgi:hypothetical protein
MWEDPQGKSYGKDPRIIPEDPLITEILIPIP